MENNDPYTAPEADMAADASIAEKMTAKEIYFSFEGRIPRKVFWFYGILGLFGLNILLYLIVFVVAIVSQLLGGLVALALFIPLIWASLAVAVKRWHDRDKSGWWILISFVPIIGTIWYLVEAGFLVGSEGSNRFGPRPADY